VTDNTGIPARFWKALKNDRTMFLGLAEGEDGHARPMTAQLEDELFDGDDYDGPVCRATAWARWWIGPKF
jgi:hypothetical protein